MGKLIHGLIICGVIKHRLIKDTLKLSHTLGHGSDLASLQPSQILSYPFSPKQAFNLKENITQRGSKRHLRYWLLSLAANGKSVFSILATSI